MNLLVGESTFGQNGWRLVVITSVTRPRTSLCYSFLVLSNGRVLGRIWVGIEN